jgi:uncharacterized OB-fold protein
MPSRLIAEGLIDEASPEPALVGSRCTRCGEVVFPRMCDCPNCVGHDTMEPLSLRGHGVLRDSVVAHRGPTGFNTPYVQAYVKLDDGPVVYGNLIGVEPDDAGLLSGTEVEMEIGVVKTLEEVDWIGWSFRPVDDRT